MDVAGVKVTFEQGLDRVERAIDEEITAPTPTPAGLQPAAIQPITSAERFQRLVESSPSAAILDKWLEIETALRRLAEANNVNLREGQPNLIRVLRQRGIISHRIAVILDELRILRNMAAHPDGENRRLSVEEAKRFGDVADEVLQILSRK